MSRFPWRSLASNNTVRTYWFVPGATILCLSCTIHTPLIPPCYSNCLAPPTALMLDNPRAQKKNFLVLRPTAEGDGDRTENNISFLTFK